MTGIAIGVTVLLFVLLLAGMPVAFTMLVTGAAGLYLTGGIYPLIGVLKETGMTVLLAEQNAEMALASTDRAYVLEGGAVIKAGVSAELARDPAIRSAYLGL